MFEFRVLVKKNKNMSITSHDRIHFVQDVFLRTYTNYIYHLKAYDPKKKMFVAKYLSNASAQFYKCLKIKQLAKTTSFGVDSLTECTVFKMFFYAHTHKQHIHYTYHLTDYDPRKKMWVAKGRSETCSRFYKRI